MWIIQPLEIADDDGKPAGKWRMTATSDEDGGGPDALSQYGAATPLRLRHKDALKQESAKRCLRLDDA